MDPLHSNFDENLASLLEQYPAVWNKANPAYKNKIMKENAIKIIASSLHCSVDTVSKRYKFLREKYRKEKIKLEEHTRSGSGAVTFQPWGLMTVLSFLDTVQVRRKTIGNLPLNSTMSQDTDDGEVFDCVDDILTSSHLPTEDLESQNTPSQTELPLPLPIVDDVPMVSSVQQTPFQNAERTPVCHKGMKQKREAIRRLMPNDNHPTEPTASQKLLDRLVTAAEATAINIMAPTMNEQVPVEGRKKRRLAYGSYVGETLHDMSELGAEKAMLAITNILYNIMTDV